MTDTSYPFTATTGHSNHAGSGFPSIPHNLHQTLNVTLVDGVHEDEGQISCICGFNDDDGNTVACDVCNRWQHILCYYPEYGDDIPADLQHWCVDCRPRSMDKSAAQQRQRESRISKGLLTNGIKRSAPKASKKKSKDSPATAYMNGLSTDKSRHDRNSASPRDQPPPAKRPKTSHRSSTSTAGTSASVRRRNGTISHQRSNSQTPETPQELYSEHFLRCYLEDEWSETHTNLHNGIAVSDKLSKWLQEADEDFHDAHGFEKRDVFVRWDGQIEQISHAEHLQIEECHDPNVGPVDLGDVTAQPAWKYVTLGEPVPNGACIGELKGHVGFKEEYRNDPSNRWSVLRHPEPFVFFHPKLPIYVDARNEGTQLRFVRRSCQPNARMQIMITEGTEYHFCFMALRDLEPGEEVAIMWDSQEGITQAINLRNNNHGNVDERQMDTIKSWVSVVLANCGPCACNLEPGQCMMSRFDRRGLPLRDDDPQPLKVPKARRKKAPQVSPLNTGQAVNSRSGSEARRVEPDEQSDTRSTSGSAGRGSVSRDITPNTHYSASGSVTNVLELSERERKKLAKEEEMFRRQEEEASGKQTRKKRGSAGPPVNTPSATSVKQFNFSATVPSKYSDSGTPKSTSTATGKISGKRSKNANLSKAPPKPMVKVVKRPKPDYVDAQTQCDLDSEEAAARPTSPASTKRFVSVTQRLLERCALNNAKRKRPPSTLSSPDLRKTNDDMDIDENTPTALTDARKSSSSPAPNLAPMALSSQTDSPAPARVGNDHNEEVPSKSFPHAQAASNAEVVPGESNPPVEPPPPWPSDRQPAPTAHQPSSPSRIKAVDMHLQMPPPQTIPFASGIPSLPAGSSTAITDGSMSQSPAAVSGPTSFLSPAISAAVNPSPARKKLSLSDYTKRSKAKDNKEAESSLLPTASSKGERERDSSPASTASGPIVPPLLPNSSDTRKLSTGSNAVEEDVKMEDAGVSAVLPTDLS